MLYPIAFQYDKAAHWPAGFGYDGRPAVPLTGIVLHSTEHQPGQSFAELCVYLRDSPAVSSHYLVDYDGTIQRLLDPGPHRAWHAGESDYAGRREWNDFAVGIEIYHRRGGPAYSLAQRAATQSLCRQLMVDHPTIVRALIAAHRWIAIRSYDDTPPVYGRKIDPSDWPDADLHAWITAL